MAEKWKNKKVKLLSFQKDLQILLAEYDYYMDCRLIITPKGIRPQIVVDTPPEDQGKRPPIAKIVKEGAPVSDVKQKEQEQRPVGKGNSKQRPN